MWLWDYFQQHEECREKHTVLHNLISISTLMPCGAADGLLYRRHSVFLFRLFFFSPSSWKALKCHSMWWKCVRIIILPFIWENRLTSMGFVSHETSTNIATDPQVSQNSTPENSWLSVCKTPYLLCWHKLSSIQWLSWAWKLIQKYVKNELEWKHIWIR